MVINISLGLGIFAVWHTSETIDSGAWGKVECVIGIQFETMDDVDKLKAVPGSFYFTKSF